jgi:hypothetical protein
MSTHTPEPKTDPDDDEQEALEAMVDFDDLLEGNVTTEESLDSADER